MSVLSGGGLSLDLPPGWEGSISDGGFALQADGSRKPTVLHAASFPLPPNRGSFGSGAVELMGNRDIFITLFEYGEASASTPLFAATEPPWPLRASEFDRNALQHGISGQSGLQRFFTYRQRAMCLYVVLGSHIDRVDLVGEANSVLATVDIS